MASSDTQICNIALGQIGVGRIADINGTSQVERDCAAIYNDARDEVLADFDWAFARAQRSLSKSSIPPEFGYISSFQLPPDCIAVRNINHFILIAAEDRMSKAESIKPKYEIFGDKLYCNLEECHIVYTKRVVDPVMFSSKFVTSLANRLSAVLANSVKKHAEMSLKWWDFYYNSISRNEELSNKGEDAPRPELNPYVEARS
jgi:hypothetical protein